MTTPNINVCLALPFKRSPVKSSAEFRGIWSSKRDYLNRVSGVGVGGTYKERKELRKSEEFPWPISNTNNEGIFVLSLYKSIFF